MFQPAGSSGSIRSFPVHHVHLVGGFSPTHLKNMRKSKWVHQSPRFGVKNKKYLSYHHLEYLRIWHWTIPNMIEHVKNVYIRHDVVTLPPHTQFPEKSMTTCGFKCVIIYNVMKLMILTSQPKIPQIHKSAYIPITNPKKNAFFFFHSNDSPTKNNPATNPPGQQPKKPGTAGMI